MLRRMAKWRLARIAAIIRLLEVRLAELVVAELGLAWRFRPLCSMPGVSTTIAHSPLALLRELGAIGRKQIAALVGLAPYDFGSGKFRGQRQIYGGRMQSK
jgi:transposase